MNEKSRLVLSSFLMLFVELMLIRWTSSNIYYLFFLTNFILLASFLGIGIGFLRVKQVQYYFQWSPLLLAAIVVLSFLCHDDYQPQVNPDTGILDSIHPASIPRFIVALIALPVIFILVTSVMAAIAGMTAASFRQFPSLQAYRLEVLGTLAGIVVFTLLALFAMPPIVWGIIITLVFSLFMWRSWRTGFSIMMLVQVSALVLMLGVFYQETMTENHFWSTYYKIQVKEYAPQSYVVDVNGLMQQIIEPAVQRLKLKPFYLKPYEHMDHHPLNNVLVIGAGTGGDVAIALAQGARHVDAVEIDAKLYDLGKQLNPDQPYSDPRVTVHINDGRAFLQQTTQRYDLIIYALTDSLMLVPGQSSLRLENYLYTLEGLSAAAAHLHPNGVFTFYSYIEWGWFVDRMSNTLSQIYQRPPCIDTYGSKDNWATVLTVSKDEGALHCPRYWRSTHQAFEQPARDDHPFIYLQEYSLPMLSVMMLLFIGVLAIYSVRRISGSLAAIRDHLDLFLMGAAFLLLETKSVVSYALLFGTTWIVNSAVFIGIIFSVYAAIEVTARVRRLNVFLLYGMLLASLLAAWMIPVSALLVLPVAARLAAASVVTFAPIFIANLIFAERLHETALSTEAMGANLIGAVFGGMLEYASLYTGYQHLLGVVLVIYSLALIWLRFVNAGAADLGANLARAATRD